MDTFFIPPEDYAVRLDGNILPRKPYLFKNDGEFLFEFLSLAECGARYFPSFAARLVLKDGGAEFIPDCFAVTDWRAARELFVIPRAVYQPVRETVAAECEYTLFGRKFRAAVLSGSKKRLAVDCLDARYAQYPAFSEPLDDELSVNGLAARPSGQRQYLILNGKIGERDYLLLAALNGGGFEIIFEECADSIEIKDGDITVVKKFSDMLRRERAERYVFDGAARKQSTAYSYGAETPVTEYNAEAPTSAYGTGRQQPTAYSYGADPVLSAYGGARLRLQSTAFSYGAEASTYREELIPYLFLEAIGAGDTACAERYLDADLRAAAETEIYEYFGNFYSVEYPKYSRFPICTAALKYFVGKNTLVRYFDFAVENGIIKNFDEIIL
ncbi:MAG: hypothetical protein LBP79_01940 [Clostridiales bacterium]|nr:hypothetical protein [Clostridiales bacterium]